MSSKAKYDYNSKNRCKHTAGWAPLKAGNQIGNRYTGYGLRRANAGKGVENLKIITKEDPRRTTAHQGNRASCSDQDRSECVTKGKQGFAVHSHPPCLPEGTGGIMKANRPITL